MLSKKMKWGDWLYFSHVETSETEWFSLVSGTKWRLRKDAKKIQPPSFPGKIKSVFQLKLSLSCNLIKKLPFVQVYAPGASDVKCPRILQSAVIILRNNYLPGEQHYLNFLTYVNLL